MTVDHRCRLHIDAIALTVDAAFDDHLPDRIRAHGPLAARSMTGSTGSRSCGPSAKGARSTSPAMS